MSLMVCSKSTKQFVKEWKHDHVLVVYDKPDLNTVAKKDTEEHIIAIGGGSVIDTAKILCQNPILAIPTTFSGTSRTSHAVYWDKKRKNNIATKKPITILRPDYLETFSKTEFYHYSLSDCLCHIIEALSSKNATSISDFYAKTALTLFNKGDTISLLNSSLLAGDAIEITGTNFIHALSYAITALYNIQHAMALTFLLPKVCKSITVIPQIESKSFIKLKLPVRLDIEKVIDEALTYPKIYENKKVMNKEILMELLK